MAFIEPMHRNKPNITYLLTPGYRQGIPHNNETYLYHICSFCQSICSLVIPVHKIDDFYLFFPNYRRKRRSKFSP